MRLLGFSTCVYSLLGFRAKAEFNPIALRARAVALLHAVKGNGIIDLPPVELLVVAVRRQAKQTSIRRSSEFSVKVGAEMHKVRRRASICRPARDATRTRIGK